MIQRLILYADDGKILTNGQEYGRIIHLAVGQSGEEFYEVDEVEFEANLSPSAYDISGGII